MIIKVLKDLNTFESDFVLKVFNSRICCFGGMPKGELVDDLILEGYIKLLESLQENPNIDEKELFNKVSNAMTLYRQHRDKECQELIYSLDCTRFDDNDENIPSLANRLTDNTTNESDLMLKFLYNQLFECLNNYTNEDKKIIYSYCLESKSKKAIYQEYNIKRNHLVKLIRQFRLDFYELLLQNGYTEVSGYLKIDNDEFATKHCNTLLVQRQKAKEQGINLYNFNDMQIYKLMRQGANFEAYANCLHIPVEQVKKYAYHTHGKSQAFSKLFLYQVQALRKEFFKNYTLNELTQIEVGQCYI